MADVRDALLDAAYDAAVTTGWQRARMADIASAAKVSRQTLYDQFGSREGLALHLALRETQRFLDGVETAMGSHQDPAHAIEAAAAFALKAADSNPLIRSILTEDGEAGLLPYLTTRAEPLIETAQRRLVAHVGAHWPGLEFAEAAELVVRLTLSYLVMPGGDDAPRRIARVAATVLDLQRN